MYYVRLEYRINLEITILYICQVTHTGITILYWNRVWRCTT